MLFVKSQDFTSPILRRLSIFLPPFRRYVVQIHPPLTFNRLELIGGAQKSGFRLEPAPVRYMGIGSAYPVSDLSFKPAAPCIHALAGFGGDREDFKLGVSPAGVLHYLFHVKVKVGQHVNLVDDKRVADCEDKRILEGLVVAFRDGENHYILHRACVKLCRADKVAHVFKYSKVNIPGSKLIEALLGHARIQMAHTAGVELDALYAGGGYLLRVHGGVNVCLHDADTELILQPCNGAHEGGGLAGTGGGHEIHKKGSLLLQLSPEFVGLGIVVGKDTGLYFDYLYAIR